MGGGTSRLPLDVHDEKTVKPMGDVDTFMYLDVLGDQAPKSQSSFGQSSPPKIKFVGLLLYIAVSPPKKYRLY